MICMDNISTKETKLFPMFSSTLRKFIASNLHIIIEKIRVFAISIIKEIYYNIFSLRCFLSFSFCRFGFYFFIWVDFFMANAFIVSFSAGKKMQNMPKNGMITA